MPFKKKTPLSDIPGFTAYESRIAIVEAWQYKGSVHDAPAFVDRNWIGYSSGDPIRKLPAGPCLLFPHPAGGEPLVVHTGDYVVRQLITLASGVPPEEKVEVWRQDEFERLFIPRRPQGAKEQATAGAKKSDAVPDQPAAPGQLAPDHVDSREADDAAA